ncbi:deoxyguanosinetriphosphate triphosphohydrolase (plasmid) [Nitrosococcus watsonii C-113]|uniref:Deoxyguanosinetriphosphate triphosphohydrolase n=2 Tax=Nitrosococcus TaxID=1227 RepID=D8KCE4_NITWC|nr:deoxyguanosinetriphosphate triphosphohydrolase [Nitrosococcus watsonii C-113]
MQWNKLLNNKRLRRPNEKPSSRPLKLNPFQLDQERIIFSQPFRRLKDKTQVHPFSDNDHVRTRLTHSLEVATVGQSLGTLVGSEIIERYELKNFKSEDFGNIIKAACLAHDIGNPPFGHIGEEAVREWFNEKENNEKLFEEMTKAKRSDFQRFDGNAQGFRIITQTENYKGNGGLQLTFATLATLMKYPWPSTHNKANKNKFGFFQSEQNYIEEIAEQVGLLPTRDGAWYRHPLAYLVEAADDICYAIIDLEDGIDMGALSFRYYEEFIKGYLKQDKEYEGWESEYKNLETTKQKISYLRNKAITKLIEEASESWLKHEVDISHGNFEYPLLDKVEGNGFVQDAKKIAKEEIFINHKKIYIEIASYKILYGLLDAFSEAALQGKGDDFESGKNKRLFTLMGEDAPKSECSRYETLMKVIDFISGMTDRFALGMYRQLDGISLGGMTPAPLEIK